MKPYTMADKENSERKDKLREEQELAAWRKKIEIIGIDIKSLDTENDSWPFLAL